MIAILTIFLAMAVKDVFGAAYTKFLQGRHPWLAGGADGTTDLLSYGFVGINIYNHPGRTTVWTIVAFAALWVASVIGTRIGALAEEWFDRRYPAKDTA